MFAASADIVSRRASNEPNASHMFGQRAARVERQDRRTSVAAECHARARNRRQPAGLPERQRKRRPDEDGLGLRRDGDGRRTHRPTTDA